MSKPTSLIFLWYIKKETLLFPEFFFGQYVLCWRLLRTGKRIWLRALHARSLFKAYIYTIHHEKNSQKYCKSLGALQSIVKQQKLQNSTYFDARFFSGEIVMDEEGSTSPRQPRKCQNFVFFPFLYIFRKNLLVLKGIWILWSVWSSL